MKKLLCVIFTVVATLSFSIQAYAYGENFDPEYYAKKYPDVVSVFGTNNPEVLYNHYLEYGAKEGRFQNAKEEEAVRGYSTNLSGILDETIAPQEGYEGYTYVDVDIEKQIVTYFYCGEIDWQAYCVSGNERAKHDTPKGTFWIIRKVPGKRLKGPTWDCWVDRWMQFTYSACGFHDASWRGNFGGQIYKSNGSHGCVNLSKQAAYELYDKVKVGTIVIVH